MSTEGSPPAWAWEAIADRPEGEELRASASRIRRAMDAQVALHFPDAAMRTIEGGEAVVLEWAGAPSTDDVVAALGLGFSYEERGVVIAAVESWDTVGWPEDLEALTIVLKRLDPETGSPPPSAVGSSRHEEPVRRMTGSAPELP